MFKSIAATLKVMSIFVLLLFVVVGLLAVMDLISNDRALEIIGDGLLVIILLLVAGVGINVLARPKTTTNDDNHG